MKALQRGRFGRRSELLGGDQLQLGLEDLDADIARAEAETPPLPDTVRPVEPSTCKREGLPSHLQREEITVDLAPAVRPCCGGPVHAIDESVSEMLDYVPARLRVLRIRRAKYRCRACGTIH